MSRFVFNRALQSALVLLVMSFVIYGLMCLMPGDPIDLMITSDPKITTEDAARLRALYGLDTPITERYWHWLTGALSGNFGYSRMFAQPVFQIIWPALGNTAILLGLSFVLALVIALPLGALAAIRPYSKLDYSINLFLFAGISVPPFWLALLLITLFSVVFGILPAGGTAQAAGVDEFWESAKYLILPIASLTIASIGGHARYMRASMIETLRHYFIRTARAKGLSPWQVITGHALRNALIPVVTVIALDFGFLFSGALVTETIFAYPGMGKLIFDAIMGNDYNLALITLLFATALTLLGNFMADLAYNTLDPRLSFKDMDA